MHEHAPKPVAGASDAPTDAVEDTNTAESGALRAKRAHDAVEPPAKRAKPSISLSMWLTSSGESADPEQLPPPSTCAAARIEDRSSVFVGYVYPLTTASPTKIAALLDNLTRVVHPSIPVGMLPPQFQHSAPNRRGSTHDMYAYRVLQLKPGRTGLGGPSDFGMEHGQEDDGEAYGAEKIMRVIRELGASDVLVVVSRWYGGQLLGPARFDHITNVARAALQHYLQDETVREKRTQLQALDRRLARARHPDQEPPPPDPYADLTLDRAERLLLARTKALQVLQRKAAEASQQST